MTKSLIRSRLYEGSTGNSLFSPISILTALNILLLGTTGEIQQEMISTLGIYIICDVMVNFITFLLLPKNRFNNLFLHSFAHLGYPRYTGLVHSQFQQIIKSMNEDIGVTISTSNALFSQVRILIKGSNFLYFCNLVILKFSSNKIWWSTGNKFTLAESFVKFC